MDKIAGDYFQCITISELFHMEVIKINTLYTPIILQNNLKQGGIYICADS